jgi:exonuclease SbcD
MKILHTSDLHLGAQWRGISRADDQQRVLDEIVALCDQHEVDALLVTGDIFSDRPTGPPARLARDLLTRLSGQLRRKRAVILLRGNHDPLELFQLMRVFVGEMAGGDRWPLVVADMPDVYKVPNLDLQIVALPYLSPRWLQLQPFAADVTPEEQIVGLSGHLARCLNALRPRVQSGMPSIFAAHVMVRGGHLAPDVQFEPGYQQELWLEQTNLPQYTSYNALGHIHLGQQIAGAGKPTWFAGAADRLDLGERDRTPQVLLVTLPDGAGGVATVEPIALTTCTPFIHEHVSGLAAVEALCAAQLASNPLGQVVIAGVPASQQAAAITRIRQALPRVDVRLALEQSALPAPAEDFDPYDVRGTVHRYLRQDYAGPDDTRQRLVAAFDELLAEPVEVPA